MGRVYEKGATGVFVTTTGDAHGSNRFEIQMDQAKLLVEQDQLYLEEFSMPEPEWSAVNREPFASMPSTKTVVETDGQNPQHNGVINGWGSAILRGEPLVADGHEGIRGLMLSNAMHLSAFLDCAVELPVDEVLYYEELKKRMALSRYRERDNTPGIVAELSNTFDGTH